MGDAAEDAFNAAMREQETREILESLCPNDGKLCDWDLDDDGIWMCLVCGETADL